VHVILARLTCNGVLALVVLSHCIPIHTSIAAGPPLNPARTNLPLPPDTLEFKSVMRLRGWNPPHEMTNVKGLGSYALSDEGVTPKGGDLNRLSLRTKCAVNEFGRVADIAEVLFNFHNLEEGQIVPLCSATYKITEKSGNPYVLTLKTITDHDLLAEVGVERDSLAVTVGASVQLPYLAHPDIGWSYVTVERIARTKKNGDKLMATVTADKLFDEFPRNGIEEKQRLEVTKGDRIDLAANYRITVRKIAPPDENRKIVGWVEFKVEHLLDADKK